MASIADLIKGLAKTSKGHVSEVYDTLTGNERIQERAKGYTEPFKNELLDSLTKPNLKLAALLEILDEESFRPGDGLITSTINHPVDAVGELAKWIAKRTNTAAGIPEQYDNPNPLLAPTPYEQVEAASDLAGMAQVGSFPFAPKSAGGTLGTFIGPKAATWSADKAAAAAKMLDDGVDPAQVWQQHMIGRMPDGKLFSEIDDSGLSLNIPAKDWVSQENGQYMAPNFGTGYAKALEEVVPGAPVRMGRIFNHPELDAAYSDGFTDNRFKSGIMGLPVSPSDAGHGSFVNGNMIELNKNLTPADAKSTTLHELQHAIQQREGWARGGSPDMFNDPLLNDYLQQSYKTKHVQDVAQKADEYLRQGDYKKALDFERAAGVMAKHDAYRRLTGEAQARATQDRLNMSLDERRNNYPLAGGKLSDIPLEQLIYRYGDNGPAMAIDAWHGSPHKFDKFSMDKIGTGEGAQAYGHGLYFADDHNVAKSYQDKLSGMEIKTKNGTFSDHDLLPTLDNTEKNAYSLLRSLGGDFDKALQEAVNRGESEQFIKALNMLNDEVKITGNSAGNLYKTSLEWPDPAREASDPLGPQHFIENDTYFSDQPEGIRKLLEPEAQLYRNSEGQQGAYITGVNGSGMLKEFADTYGGQEAALKRMQELGIPGIRYLDGGSRGAGEGSYNYVVFDDQIPKIVERNGQPLQSDNLNSSLLAKYLREGQLSPQELAQYETNAVKMTDSGKHHYNLANANAQGGTPESRAGDLGFDSNGYHTTAADIKQFKPSSYRGASFFSATPEGSINGAMAGVGDNTSLGTNVVYPVMIDTSKVKGLSQLNDDFFQTLPDMATENQVIDKIGNKNWNDYYDYVDDQDLYRKRQPKQISFNEAAKTRRGVLQSDIPDYSAASGERFSSDNAAREGFTGFIQNDEGGVSLAAVDPKIIRSRFAAFDPLRKDSSNLLASYLLPATMLGFGMYNEKKKGSLADLLGAQ